MDVYGVGKGTLNLTSPPLRYLSEVEVKQGIVPQTFWPHTKMLVTHKTNQKRKS